MVAGEINGAIEEFNNLLEHSSKHLQEVLITAFYTGMRLGEILNLTWDKIDFKNRIITLEKEDTKDREKRTIPLCRELFYVLKQKECEGRHKRHVFTYKNEALKDIRTALTKACKRANITYGRFKKEGFIFHDLRHTFNTNMRKAGVAESVIMKITGHATREMFERYNTIDAEDKEEAVRRMEQYVRESDNELTKVVRNGSLRLIKGGKFNQAI